MSENRLTGEKLEMTLRDGIAGQLCENKQLSRAETREQRMMFPLHFFLYDYSNNASDWAGLLKPEETHIE